MPKGSLGWKELVIFLKLTKIPCAVSGRRYEVAASSPAPTDVLNMVLKRSPSPKGSEKPETWPEDSQTFGFITIAASKPYISSRESTNFRHQRFLKLFFNATPSGP